MQAEDGIRDGHVTGVQTCALPIYLVRRNVPDTGGSPNRLHVQLPRRLEILHVGGLRASSLRIQPRGRELGDRHPAGRHFDELRTHLLDRKSTRLNSSHVAISYAVLCLKKKNNTSKL